MHPLSAAEPHRKEEKAHASDLRVPLFVLVAALLLYFLRFGYDYGVSDQDELLPNLLHRLHPDVLAQDWFVLTQTDGFGIRTSFVFLLQIVSWVLPTWGTVLVFYVAGWLLIAGAVYSLSITFTRHRLSSAAAVLVALVLTPQWTLGGNDLVHSMLVPSMWGWGLGLWGLVYVLRDRLGWAAVFLGLATWVQALVGLQLTGLLGVILLGQVFRKQLPLRPLLRFSGLFLLIALPVLGPLVYGQMAGGGPVAAESQPSLFYILASFRAPHHYLFFSFPVRSLVRFGLLIGSGGLSFLMLRRHASLRHASFIVQATGIVAMLCIAAFLFTERVPVMFIAQLQFFKITVLAKLLAVILVCGGLFAWLPAALQRPFARLLDFRRGGLAVAVAAWLVVLIGMQSGVGVLRNKVGPFARENDPPSQLALWAQAETGLDALFAVPPSWSGFRSQAQRAIVVNFKAFPYHKAANFEWFDRLTQWAPVPLPDRGSPALQDSLDAAFLRMPAALLHRRAQQYGVDYVIRSQPIAPPHPAFEPVHRTGDWIVYRIASPDDLAP